MKMPRWLEHVLYEPNEDEWTQEASTHDSKIQYPQIKELTRKVDKYCVVVFLLVWISPTLFHFLSNFRNGFYPNGYAGETSIDFWMDSVRILFHDSELDINQSNFLWMIILSIPAVIHFYLLWTAIKRIHVFLKPFKEGKPFPKGAGYLLQHIGWLFVVCGICNNLYLNGMHYYQYQLHNVGGLLSDGKIISFEWYPSLYFTWLLAGMILIVVSKFVRYAETLQADVDSII